MAKVKIEDGMTELGAGLVEALKEVGQHRRGEIALSTRKVAAMPADEVKAIRRKVAKSRREFEALFGVPAGTLEGWETGRRQPDIPARVLLRVIAADPDAVQDALRA